MNKENKHTNGPWEETYCLKDENWGVCISGGGDVIADCIRTKADAVLMASAPDLLEALQELVDLSVARNMNRAKAAIAKATGK